MKYRGHGEETGERPTECLQNETILLVCMAHEVESWVQRSTSESPDFRAVQGINSLQQIWRGRGRERGTIQLIN